MPSGCATPAVRFGLAVGAAVLYALSVVLLLTVATAFFTTGPTKY